jgi:flagellar hook-basal body complex protein FliE
MSYAIKPIEPLSQSLAIQTMAPPAAPASAGPMNFTQLIGDGIGSLNADMTGAEAALSKLASGQHVEIHDLMIGMERARISVQTFVQVRNKLIDSYQDLMRMQL